MLALLATAVGPALSTGFGLSPSSCLLPHHSTHGPSIHESDLMLTNGRLHDPRAALLRAPVQNTTTQTSVPVPAELRDSGFRPPRKEGPEAGALRPARATDSTAHAETR